MKKEKTEFRTAAEKLVSQMTVDEKISQLRHAAPAVGRLGIPEYNYWNECLHGVARSGAATPMRSSLDTSRRTTRSYAFSSQLVFTSEKPGR